MNRVNAGNVSAGAVKRGVAESDNAGETKYQIERKREQNRDQNLAHERELIAEREIAAENDDPGDCLDQSGAALAQRGGDRISHGSGSPEQAGGSPHQQADHRGIDEEGAELGHQVFAGSIADPQQQGGDEWTA